MVTCYDRGLFTSSDLYAPPQHVVPSHAAGVASEGILWPLGGRFMQDPASELRRIPLPRSRVNSYPWIGPGCLAPSRAITSCAYRFYGSTVYRRRPSGILSISK